MFRLLRSSLRSVRRPASAARAFSSASASSAAAPAKRWAAALALGTAVSGAALCLATARPAKAEGLAAAFDRVIQLVPKPKDQNTVSHVCLYFVCWGIMRLCFCCVLCFPLIDVVFMNFFFVCVFMCVCRGVVSRRRRVSCVVCCRTTQTWKS